MVRFAEWHRCFRSVNVSNVIYGVALHCLSRLPWCSCSKLERTLGSWRGYINRLLTSFFEMGTVHLYRTLLRAPRRMMWVFLLQWCCCSFDPIFCKRRTRWRHGWKYDASPDSLALQLSLFTRCRTHLTSTDLVVLSTSRMWVCGGLAVGRRWRMVVLQLRHCNWEGVRGWTKTDGCMLEADGDTYKILVKRWCYCTLYIYIYIYIFNYIYLYMYWVPNQRYLHICRNLIKNKI